MGVQIWATSQSWTQNMFFFHFLKFGSLVFCEITCSDSLQQCPTCSRSNIHTKILWPKFGPNKQKLCPKLVFFTILSSWFFSFCEIAYNNSLQQYLTSSRGKTHKQNFWSPIWGYDPKSGPKLVSFVIF